MSKKHFQAIASIIFNERNTPENDDRIRNGMDNSTRIIAIQMANYFATENPKFDRARFLAACGLEND